jgi:hypothetical protein
MEQVKALHLAVYDQKNDLSVLRKATTSKPKHFAKVVTLHSISHISVESLRELE